MVPLDVCDFGGQALVERIYRIFWSDYECLGFEPPMCPSQLGEFAF